MVLACMDCAPGKQAGAACRVCLLTRDICPWAQAKGRPKAEGAPVQSVLPRLGAGRTVRRQLARLVQQPLARHHAVHQAQLRPPMPSLSIDRVGVWLHARVALTQHHAVYQAQLHPPDTPFSAILRYRLGSRFTAPRCLPGPAAPPGMQCQLSCCAQSLYCHVVDA